MRIETHTHTHTILFFIKHKTTELTKVLYNNIKQRVDIAGGGKLAGPSTKKEAPGTSPLRILYYIYPH